MINEEYVNDSVCTEMDFIKDYNAFMESCDIEIDNMFADFNMLHEKVMLESEIMGTVPEDMMMVYEDGKKNIFTVIGETVIKIYNKIVELIDTAIDKIKSISFKKKTDIQKIQVYMKKNPSLANEAFDAFKSGALEVGDAKNLKEIDDAFDEILKLAKQQDVKPGTLKDKWEKAKKKFENADKSAIAKTVGVAGSVITLALAVKTFNSKCADATDNYNSHKAKVRKEKAEIYDRLKDAKVIKDDTGKWRTLLQIWREKNGLYNALNGKNLSLIDKMANGFTTILDRLDKNNNAGKRLHENLKEEAKKLGPKQYTLDID